MRPKKQPMQVGLAACPLCVSYWTNVRGMRPGKRVTRDLWLLLTDWPVTDAASAVRIFTMYRKRWSVEDSIKFLKTCLGS